MLHQHRQFWWILTASLSGSRQLYANRSEIADVSYLLTVHASKVAQIDLGYLLGK